MANIQAWPEEATQHVNQILNECQELGSIVETCIYLIKERRQGQVEPFVPDIERKAASIRNRARAIELCDHRTVGRAPLWIHATLEIRLIAEKIIMATDIIRENIPSNRWKSVDHVLRLTIPLIEKIEDEINIIPMPDVIPAPFREIEDTLRL